MQGEELSLSANHDGENKGEDISIEKKVFSVPMLMENIVSHHLLFPALKYLLRLRLVSKEFNNAVLHLNQFQNNIPTISISVLKITNESGTPCRLQLDQLTAIEPRLYHSVTVGFGRCNEGRGPDYQLLDNLCFANLMDICDRPGECIRHLTLKECNVLEHRLHFILRTINNFCPNLNSLNITVTLTCYVADHDRDFEMPSLLQPFLSMRKLDFRTCAAQAENVKACGHNSSLLSTLVSSCPYLDSLEIETHLDPNLELANTKCLKYFTCKVVTDFPFSRMNVEKLRKSINLCSATLEELSIILIEDSGFPTQVETLSDDDAVVVDFSKLRKCQFLHFNIPPFKFSPFYMSLILGGRVGQLQTLKLYPEDDGENILLKLDVQPTLRNVRKLEISSKPSELHRLVKCFLNLVELELTVLLSERRNVQDDVPTEVLNVFHMLPRLRCLTKSKVHVRGVFSIRQLTQVLECVGNGYFETAMRDLEISAENEEINLTDLELLGNIFGIDQLEGRLLPMLEWMRNMKNVRFDNIMMPPDTDILDRLTQFIEHNQLPIHYFNCNGNNL